MTTKTYRRRLSATSPAARLAAWSEPDTNGGCLLWTGSINERGYGQIGVSSGKWRVHRLAWVLANGAIPPGMHVLHRCDIRTCVNPAHLFLGTNADNVADMVNKGRNRACTGVQNGQSKLTCEIVRSVWARINARESGASIARDIGVSQTAVSNIKVGRTWRCVTGAGRYVKKTAKNEHFPWTC